eukprot:TRINITY_DN46773_c0_g1_i1.p1 TRINITY_DN46773_c0_g1~~TRINITY_DN46773_c0_g1_i1.p1  ORF type:complete len:856 (+),score=183.84 TRINITY_DN46773_c0_g1_i1:51-2570(+)
MSTSLSAAMQSPLQLLAQRRPAFLGAKLRLRGQRRHIWRPPNELTPYQDSRIPEIKYAPVPKPEEFRGGSRPDGKPFPFRFHTTNMNMLAMPQPGDKHLMRFRTDKGTMIPSFAEMGVSRPVAVALEEQGITEPSPVQQLACPLALEGKTVLMAAETGAGKTVAFVAPALQLLRERIDKGFRPRPQRPSVVILCPTKELIQQTYSVTKRLGNHLGLVTKRLFGGLSYKEKGELDSTYHVLVTTLLEYLTNRDEGRLVDTDVMTVCCDEADTLFGGSAGSFDRIVDRDMLHELLRPLLLKQFERDSYLGRHKVQFLMACAGLTSPMMEFISEWVPHVHYVQTPGLHQSPPSLRHKFWWVRQRHARYAQLRALLQTCGHTANAAEAEAKKEKERRDFWFPDAITFERPTFSPISPGSWAGNKGIPEQRRATAPEPHYQLLESYPIGPDYETNGPPPGLGIKPGVEVQAMLLKSSKPNTDEKGIVKSESRPPAFSTSTQLYVPEEPEPAVMQWGPTRIRAAPFTASPGLQPQQNPPTGQRVIIFVQKWIDARGLCSMLTHEGYNVACFRRMIGVMANASRVAEYERWATGQCNILVTTDLGARGLDHPVHAVINYDLPMTSGEYLRRAGRAGRFGRKGVVHSVVVSNYTAERMFARALESALAKGKSLEGMASEKESLKPSVKDWWEKRKRRTLIKQKRRDFQGYLTEEEERLARQRTIDRVDREMMNPRAPFGVSGNMQINQQALERRWFHMSWQYHATTGGTGNYRNKQAPIADLLKSTSSHGYISKHPHDLKASMFYKPVSPQKLAERVRKFGKRYRHLARPGKLFHSPDSNRSAIPGE